MSGLESFPLFIEHDRVDNQLIYTVTAKLGYSLFELLDKTKNKKFSFKTSIQIGLQLLKCAEELHKRNFVCMDWDTTNISLRSHDLKSEMSSELVLFNFCAANTFRKFLYMSKPADQMSFRPCDDLKKLFRLLIRLVGTGSPNMESSAPTHEMNLMHPYMSR